MNKQLFSSYREFYKNQLLDDCIPFWMQSDLLDKQYGGYITSVDRAGRAYNTDKSVWFQGRGLWTFSALCARYGLNQDWLIAAESGKAFLESKCIDTDGRMFFCVTAEGMPLRKRRYMYSESFYVIAMAEYGSLMRESCILEKAAAKFDLMLSIYRDASSDPFKITPKGFADTRSERVLAVPMVIFSAAQVLRRCIPEKSDYYTKTANDVAGDILQYHYRPDLCCMLECVGPNGEFINNPAGRTVNPGHSIENSWFLLSNALSTKNNDLKQKALNILDWSSKLGWDNQYGGYLYFVDIDGRPCEQLEWDMKLWWVHDEALIANLLAFAATANIKYWKAFERSHMYAFGHFADKEYGEWFGYLHRDGVVSHTQKGSMWKGPFHHPRALMLCEKILGLLEENKPIDGIL